MARALVLPACALILAACQSPSIEGGQAAVSAAVAPVVVAAREAVPTLPPQPVLPVATATPAPTVYPGAVDLIVEFEVSSPGYYGARLAGVYYPGGASGPTWGIGYDGGHQTSGVILHDWQLHESRERLAESAGVTGNTAKARIGEWQGIRTAYAYAYRVFADVSVPEYHRRAQRAFGDALGRLPPPAEGALVSLVYNRGGSMTGNARREMRAIRDECLPAADVACVARELRAMCRLWQGTPNGPGLCRRRDAEADLSLQPGAPTVGDERG